MLATLCSVNVGPGLFGGRDRLPIFQRFSGMHLRLGRQLLVAAFPEPALRLLGLLCRILLCERSVVGTVRCL